MKKARIWLLLAGLLAAVALVVASVLGILFYASVALVERLTMGWHASARAE